MPKWEMCRIKSETREKKGFFTPALLLTKYAVITDTGLILDQGDVPRDRQMIEDAISRITKKLLDQGWEPIEFDTTHEHWSFKRKFLNSQFLNRKSKIGN